MKKFITKINIVIAGAFILGFIFGILTHGCKAVKGPEIVKIEAPAPEVKKEAVKVEKKEVKKDIKK